MELDVSSQEIAHLETLVATLRRRQRVLETQRAHYDAGAVPSHIVLELEDIARELGRNETELRRRRGPIADRNPYLGLLTFDEASADRFFGRDALVADLIARAARRPFLAVLGPSGSGKSSVVRAGLIPMLKAGALPGSDQWRYALLRPGVRPLDALAAELARLQGSDLDLALRLRANLTAHTNALLLAADLLRNKEIDQRLVLVVDQFEELWTLAPSEERTRFLELLLTAGSAPDTPLLLVLAMRADFLHRAAEHPALARAIGEHDVIVSPMSADELRAAIVRPAAATGGGFEPGLVEELVAQTLGRPGALPLLEYTLQELWKQRQPDATMTWDAYQTLGGIEGTLAARADALLVEHYTPEQQDDLRRLLLRLVQPGEGAADTRRRAFLADLVPAGSSLDSIQALVKPLADERLLTTGRDEITGAQTVEISHEALIRAWPAFGRWIADARADLRFQLQLEQAAREWQASGENADLLWIGLRLAQAEAWIERAQPQLNARDQAFLDASRAQFEARRRAEEAMRHERESLLEARASAERRNAARLRVFLAIGSVLLLIAIGLIVYVFDQGQQLTTALTQTQQQSRISDAQANAGEALFELTRGNGDRALLLARAAVLADTQPSPLLVVRAIRQSTQQTIAGRVLRGHTGGVSAVAWSPDGKQLLTGSWDQTARVWDAASGQPLRTLQGHTDAVTAVAWSPDGKQLLTGSWDQTARVWDAASGQLLHTLQGHTNAVSAVAWSPNGKQLLTGSLDQTARVWDAASGQLLRTLEGHTDAVTAVAWSPDGKQLLTGSGDQTARVWDTASGQPLRTLQGHKDRVWTVAWSPDGKQLLTGGWDKTARVWDAASGQPLRTLQGHTGFVNAVAWSPDGKQLLTGSSKTARVWDAASGQPLRTLQGHTDGVTAVAWSPDGKQLLTGSSDTTAGVWDAASGQPLRTLYTHMSLVMAVAWSPNGKQLLTGNGDTTAWVWATASGQLLRALYGHRGFVNAVAWSPDGKQLLTGSSDGTARVWDAASGQTVRTLQGHIGAVTAVAWSPDGKQLLTGSGDKTARVWDAASGKLLCTLQGHTDGVNAVAWSPDGKQLLTGSDDQTARVWDAASGQPLRTLEGHTGAVNAVAWSPDGKQLLTGSSDKTVGIWIADDKPIIAELTRRVCNTFTDETIRQTIPTWRGCAAELAAVAADLKEYDALRPRQ